jgi:guanylate kinase
MPLEKNGKVVIFSAPSGAGKTTIVKHLLSYPEFNLAFSISACCRPKRSNEIHEKDYYFLSLEEFKRKITTNEFLEWQEVYKDNYYGTLKSEIDRIWSNNHHAIFDVDVQGGLNLKKIFGDKALAIFVMPPSIDVLEVRLRSRKTETEEKIQLRLAKAQSELQTSSQFDKIILNDNLDKAIIEAEKMLKEFLQPVINLSSI